MQANELLPKTITFKINDIELTYDSDDVHINTIFNQLPIRVINTSKFPMFYADDIGKILGITSRLRDVLRKFDDTEIVQPSVKTQFDIITFRNDGRVHRHKILLTIFGVYRLIMISKSQLAENFRIWFYKLIEKIRGLDTEDLRTRNEELMCINGTLVEANKRQQEQLNEFESYLDKVYVFRIPFDPKLIQQINLHEDDVCSEDSLLYEQEEFKNENTIDDYDAYEKFIMKYPNMSRVCTRFKLTDSPTPMDFTKYNVAFKTWCKDSSTLITSVKKSLSFNMIDCKQDNIFECSESCIVNCVKKFAIVDKFEYIQKCDEKTKSVKSIGGAASI